jgi:hypothetical protein
LVPNTRSSDRTRFAVTPHLENVAMAAVIELRTGQALTEAPGVHDRPAPAGPGLRLIHGGRSAQARQMRRVFLVRRLAVVAGLILAAWFLAQLVGAALTPIDTAGAPVAEVAAVQQVRQGDTLWALAAAVDPDADPRDVVDQIISLNQGNPAISAGGQLIAGESLRLPVGS